MISFTAGGAATSSESFLGLNGAHPRLLSYVTVPRLPVVRPNSGWCCNLLGRGAISETISRRIPPVYAAENDFCFSYTSSYVDHVNLYMFSGTGIYIAAPGSNSSPPGATNSGPYSNIAVSTGSGTSTCIDVETQTRGIHGVTCTGNSTTQNTSGDAAIYVNAGNNSIEDIQIEYFWDGIEVGNVLSPAVVGNIVFSNILGSHMQNVVHICGPHPSSSTFGGGSTFGQCSINNATNGAVVSDVTILQAENYNYFHNGIVTATSVLDDTTGTSIEGCSNIVCGINVSTALYVLGEPIGGIPGAYSRFTVNPAYPSSNGNYGPNSAYVPTWGVGNSSITSPSDACFTPGALYSNTAGASNSAVYVCTYNGTSFIWKFIA